MCCIPAAEDVGLKLPLARTMGGIIPSWSPLVPLPLAAFAVLANPESPFAIILFVLKLLKLLDFVFGGFVVQRRYNRG